MKILVLLAAFGVYPSHAADKVLNGGDACERRFGELRADLQDWIRAGGAQNLRFPDGLDEATYTARMKEALGESKFSCTDGPLHVAGAEKVCVNLREQSGSARILCRRGAFLALSQDEQYRLAHHEYAGVAGMEKNDGEASSYGLSNQIAGHLDTEIVKRLSVKGALGSLAAIHKHFADFFGVYRVEACSTATNIPAETNPEPDLCNTVTVEIQPGPFGPEQSGVYLNFLTLKKPMFGAGTVLARTGACQLGYGAATCGPAYSTGDDYPANDKPLALDYTSRLEKLGDSLFLDRNIQFTDGTNHFRKWSLVLRKLPNN